MEENNVNEVANENVPQNETKVDEVSSQIEEYKKTINTLNGKITTIESEKEEITKKADELIKKTVHEKRSEIENTYSEVLVEAEKRLKVAEAEKEKEKKKNLESIVEKNTRTVRENNVYLNNEIKRMLKESKMPQFVNSTLYLSIWSPSNAGEFFIGVLVFLIIVAIPTILCFVVFADKLKELFDNEVIRMIVIACIYLLDFFIFGSIWLIVDKLSKKDNETLKKVKELRKNIADNKKEIEKITKRTNSETTDDQFDYTKLDREIEAGRIEVENYKTKKEDAINNFINVTQDEITNKIKNDIKADLDRLEAEEEAVKKELSETQKKMDELKINSLNGNSI